MVYLLPIAVFAFSWSLMVPVVTLLRWTSRPAAAAWPHRCRPASAAWPTVLSPASLRAGDAFAARTGLTSIAMMAVGTLAWVWVKPRLDAQGGAGPSR